MTRSISHLKDARMKHHGAPEKIFETMAALAQSTDLKEICEKIMDCLFLYFKGIRGGVVLVKDDHSGYVKEMISRSKDQAKVRYSKPIVDRVMQEAKAFIQPQSFVEQEEDHPDRAGMRQVKSILCLPLKTGKGVLGVIYAYALDGQADFTEKDALVFGVLSSPAALAIENTLLHSKVMAAEEMLQKAREKFDKDVERRTAELVEVIKQLQELSITDGLTGLYNHRHLVHMLEIEYKRAIRYKRSFAFLMLDIDYFKEVNDNFGHPCGDSVLQEIAQILKDSVRSTDLVARYGGDEMAVILLETSQKMAMKVAHKLRRQIEGHAFYWENESFHVTVSIGVAGALEEGVEDWNGLLNAADRVLYQAKDKGRNTVLAYEPEDATAESLSDRQLGLFSS